MSFEFVVGNGHTMSVHLAEIERGTTSRGSAMLSGMLYVEGGQHLPFVLFGSGVSQFDGLLPSDNIVALVQFEVQEYNGEKSVKVTQVISVSEEPGVDKYLPSFNAKDFGTVLSAAIKHMPTPQAKLAAEMVSVFRPYLSAVYSPTFVSQSVFTGKRYGALARYVAGVSIIDTLSPSLAVNGAQYGMLHFLWFLDLSKSLSGEAGFGSRHAEWEYLPKLDTSEREAVASALEIGSFYSVFLSRVAGLVDLAGGIGNDLSLGKSTTYVDGLKYRLS